MTAKHTLLFVALAATLFAATPAFAQDVPPDTTETDASVPKDRLVGEYADPLFAGDEVAAGDAITALRTGGDFTVVTEIEVQAKNADGTPKTDANGNPVMEIQTIETTVVNANGPMGWGEVDHSLGLAQALVENGEKGSFDEALLGGSTVTTVTDANGNTTTTVTFDGEGILGMRADGMGWGQIAKELGFKSLGEVKSGRYADADAEDGATTVAADAKGKGAAKVASDSRGKSAGHKSERAAKAERVTGKPEKVERIAKVERPAKIDRPERPSKPERVGRP